MVCPCSSGEAARRILALGVEPHLPPDGPKPTAEGDPLPQPLARLRVPRRLERRARRRRPVRRAHVRARQRRHDPLDGAPPDHQEAGLHGLVAHEARALLRVDPRAGDTGELPRARDRPRDRVAAEREEPRDRPRLEAEVRVDEEEVGRGEGLDELLGERAPTVRDRGIVRRGEQPDLERVGARRAHELEQGVQVDVAHEAAAARGGDEDGGFRRRHGVEEEMQAIHRGRSLRELDEERRPIEARGRPGRGGSRRGVMRMTVRAAG